MSNKSIKGRTRLNRNHSETDKSFLFYNAFQNSTDAILLTDLKGMVIEVNQAFCALFGYTREEIIGKRTNVLRSEKTDDSLYKNMWHSINVFGEWKGEIVNRNKNGDLVPVLLSITPIIQDGEKIGYMGIEIDIREQIKMKQRMAQSERLATIGQMAAKVAHEIRNPLSSISLNAELLEDELSDPDSMDSLEAKSLLNSIIREVDRLANLTTDYLQFSRLPTTKMKKENLTKILFDFVHFMETEASSNNTQIKLNLPDKQIPVEIDVAQIRRVLINLTRNSFEAMPDGGTIHIELKISKAWVELHFRDSGHGIKEQNANKIFEPFFTNKEMGTGLGLSISRQIMDEHGGSIQCLDSNEKGAYFLIKFPRIE